MKVERGFHMTLSFQEWYGIINALRHTSATYSDEYSGVSLSNLAGIIAAKALKEEEHSK